MKRKSTNWIVLHCTATPPSVDIGRAEIDQWHKAAGWSGIGYHVVIRRDGRVEYGRPLYDVGSHVKGFNSKSVGVVMVGGVDSRKRAADNFTPAQWQTLVKVVRELIEKFPSAVVIGHRDFSPDRDRDGQVEPQEWIKQCPCFDARAWARRHDLPAAPMTPLTLAGMVRMTGGTDDDDRQFDLVERKPVLKRRKVWGWITGWLGGGGAGAFGMFAGWDPLAILIICLFVSLWAAVFLYLYRKEIREQLGIRI